MRERVHSGLGSIQNLTPNPSPLHREGSPMLPLPPRYNVERRTEKVRFASDTPCVRPRLDAY